MSCRKGFIVSAVIAVIAIIVFVFFKAEKINNLLAQFKKSDPDASEKARAEGL